MPHLRHWQEYRLRQQNKGGIIVGLLSRLAGTVAEEEATLPVPIIEEEYHRIDMTTGERLDVLLLDSNGEIPEDCKRGWGEGLFDPVWDFTKNTWVEGISLDYLMAIAINDKINEFDVECQRRITSGFEHNGDKFQFNEKDQANFNQQLSLLLLDPTTEIVVWKTENNGVKEFTREQFIETCKASERHKRSNIGRYWQLKAFLSTNDFTSVEEVIEVNYDINISTNTDTETEPDTTTNEDIVSDTDTAIGTEPEVNTGV